MSSTNPLNVLVVGLGPLGRRVISDLYGRGLGQVVAAIDVSPKLVGRDLSEIVPGVPSGVTVQAHLDEVSDWGAIQSAVVTTSSDLELCMDVFRGLLARGIAVASTCEELAWPWLRHPIMAAELGELAVRKRGRIVGTGVNPGFLMDALPAAMTTACRRVDSIRVVRLQDASTRRIPFQRKIGVTMEPGALKTAVEAGQMGHVGLGESLHLLAHHVGLEISRWDETAEPLVAEEELDCGLGTIAVGQCRGLRQVASAYVPERENPAVELVFHAAVGEAHPVDRVVIHGEPDLRLEIPGGLHGDVATSAILLNTLPTLLDAEPRLHTMASLPLRGCARVRETHIR
ncbi:MAG: hypothetical protein ACI8PQ_001644 [Planctomycetota bacterium]